MTRMGVVVNPAAGHGRGRRLGAAVMSGLAGLGIAVTDLSGTDAEGAAARARDGVIGGLDALVVVGGDGIVHLGVNAVAGTAVPLGVVPVGNGNDIARALGLPVRDVDGAVRAIGDALLRGPRLVDAVRVTGNRPGSDTWFLGVLSAGLDAAVNARANVLTWPGGTGRYVRALAGELRRFRPYGYRLLLDGVEQSGPRTLVALANGPAFGGGMHIAPDARFDDGLLDVVLVGPVSRTELVRVFPRVYRGTHVTHPDVTIVRAREVILEPLPGELHPHPPAAYADGELLGPLPLRCVVEAGALAVLAPARGGAA